MLFACQTYNPSLENPMVVYVSIVEGGDGQAGSACRAFYSVAIFAYVYAVTLAASESCQSPRFATLTASLGIGVHLATGQAKYWSIVRKNEKYLEG